MIKAQNYLLPRAIKINVKRFYEHYKSRKKNEYNTLIGEYWK